MFYNLLAWLLLMGVILFTNGSQCAGYEKAVATTLTKYP